MFAEFGFNFEVFYHVVILMISNNYKNSKDILKTYIKNVFFVEMKVEEIKFESGESDKYFTYLSDKSFV